MKRLLMGFATCALIMASCTKQEIMETAEDGQGSLSFAAGVGKQSATRAAEFNNDALKDAANPDITSNSSGIIINAYQNANTWGKWYTDAVVHDGTNWKLKTSVRFRNENPTKYITYFPKNTKLVEVMDATETLKSTFETADFISKFPQFTYTVADNSAVQEDLIAGITEVDAKKTDITLGMRHILSQVNFGTMAYKGAKIQIQNIKIKGVGNEANFTYRAVNSYPIGDWTTPQTFTSEYSYYNHTNEATGVAHTEVPVDATSGHKYIFGDGGNWGPGKGVETHYPAGTGGTWENYNTTTPQAGLKNSLMLLPQKLTDKAKVTFEYKIQDVDKAYVAGNESTWAEGEFSLDFSTGTESGKHYNSEWEQNYRYLYLIDFTDFLDGIALTFDVDVEMYPWENYDGEEGIINIKAAGQPTQADMNATAFINGDAWHIASQNEAAPDTYDPIRWAQVMRDEVWDLSAYDFKHIGINETFTLNFQNVIFNTRKDALNPNVPTTIMMTLPDGFSAEIPGVTTNITVTTLSPQFNTWIISKGDKSKSAAITITNDRYYRNSTNLQTGIEAANRNNLKFGYSGTDAIDLTTMQPTDQTTAKSLTVKFNCTITPTVGATENGIWTYNTETKTATWIYVTWNNLNDAKAAVASASANAIIYCSDATDIASLSTALGEPTTMSNSPVHVVFSKAAKRTGDTTANGVWTYTPATKTATWEKTTAP